MASVPSNQIAFHPASFGDFNGRVFHWDGGLYRGVAASRAALYNRLFDDGTIARLVDRKLLVSTERTPLRVDGFGLQPGSLTAFPDGHTVLAGRRGGALVLVDLAGLLNLRDHGREQACALLGTGFTEADWALFVRDLPYEDSCPRG